MTVVTPVGQPTSRPTGFRVLASPRWRRRNLTFDRVSFFLVFLVVPVIGYLAFVVSPFIQAAYFSLTSWTGFSPEMKFVGLANYAKLLDDDTFRKAVGNSVTLAIVLPIVTLTVALIFASMITVGGPSSGAPVILKSSLVCFFISFSIQPPEG